MPTESNPALAALDAMGLVYNVRRSRSNTAYAGFRWEAPPTRRMRAFTVLFEDDALRLALYQPLGPGMVPDERECLGRQRPLPLARLFEGEDDGKLELTLSIPMGKLPPDSFLVEQFLLHLAANADDLLGEPTGASRQPPRLVEASDDVPLDAALRSFDLHPHQVEGSFRVTMKLPRLGVDGHFDTDHLGVGWLRVSAHLADDNSLDIDRMRPGLPGELQLWAPVGRFALRPTFGDRQLGVEVAAPFLGRSTADTIADAMRRATILLGTAYKHATGS